MITNYLLIITLTSQEVNLKDLPPAPAIIEAIINNDVQSYNGLILKTQRIVSQFKRLSDKEKNVLLKKWAASLMTSHAKQTIGMTRFPVKVSSDLNFIDVSKVDLLLITWNRRTIFHREDLLRGIYNSRQNPHVSFDPTQVSTVSNNLKSAANFASNTFRLDRYSFQSPFDVRADWLFKWIKNGLKPSELKKLDIASLYSKKSGKQ